MVGGSEAVFARLKPILVTMGVDMSTTVWPVRMNPRRPPGPHVTTSTSLPSGGV